MSSHNKSTFEKLSDFFMGRGALKKAAGEKPAAVAPQSTDYLKQAVEESMRTKAARDKLSPAAAKVLATPMKAKPHPDRRVP